MKTKVLYSKYYLHILFFFENYEILELFKYEIFTKKAPNRNLENYQILFTLVE